MEWSLGDLFLYKFQVPKSLPLILLNLVIFLLSIVSTPIFLPNSIVLVQPTPLFPTVNPHIVLLDVLILPYSSCCCWKFFLFIGNIFMRVSDYLVVIIPWLYQYCSARLECILVVFRIVVISRSSYSIFLELPRGVCY